MPELQDIFQLYGGEYRQNHKLSYAQAKAMTAIEQCRTAALGCHIDTCEHCGNVKISYNSCRNRHCPKCQTRIVPGGGLDALGRWINSRKKFFLPVKVLSRVFRGKFLYHLQQAKPNFFGQQKHLENSSDFQRLLDACYKKKWIVYCKPPFKTASCVVEYLGRYTHRVAISNNRILKIDDGKVSFKWRDYKDNGKWKVMNLTADESIRRFLMHILPPGFMKIRHYGLLASRNKTKRITLCKHLTNTPVTGKKTSSLHGGFLLRLRIILYSICGLVAPCLAATLIQFVFHTVLSVAAICRFTLCVSRLKPSTISSKTSWLWRISPA